MAKKYKNAISTTAGFTFNSSAPLDDRDVVSTKADLDTLVKYEGMSVMVVNDPDANNNCLWFYMRKGEETTPNWHSINDEITNIAVDGATIVTNGTIIQGGGASSFTTETNE